MPGPYYNCPKCGEFSSHNYDLKSPCYPCRFGLPSKYKCDNCDKYVSVVFDGSNQCSCKVMLCVSCNKCRKCYIDQTTPAEKLQDACKELENARAGINYAMKTLQETEKRLLQTQMLCAASLKAPQSHVQQSPL